MLVPTLPIFIHIHKCGGSSLAVVSRDVPPFTIVAGNPARPIGERPQPMGYRLNYRPFLL